MNITPRRDTINLSAAAAADGGDTKPISGNYDWVTIVSISTDSNFSTLGGLGTQSVGIALVDSLGGGQEANPVAFNVGDVIRMTHAGLILRNTDTVAVAVVIERGYGEFVPANVFPRQDTPGALVTTPIVNGNPVAAAVTEDRVGGGALVIAGAANTKGIDVLAGFCYARGDGALTYARATISCNQTAGPGYCNILEAICSGAADSQAFASLARGFFIPAGMDFALQATPNSRSSVTYRQRT